MAVFRVRLEDPDSKEFRQVSVSAEDESEARETVLRIEAKHVDFVADDETIAEIEEVTGMVFEDALDLTKEEQREIPGLRGKARARLNSHRQAVPYKIKRVEGGEDSSP